MKSIIVEKKVNDKILWLVENYKNEISGWLTGEVKDGAVIIDNILFPHQEVGGASVDTDGKSLVKLRKEYGDECKRIIGHWHSHNTMMASWSTIDEEFMSEFMQTRKLGVFVVSAIDNKHAVRLELRDPVDLSVNMDSYSLSGNDELAMEMGEIIREKVTEKKFKFKNYGGYYDGYGREILLPKQTKKSEKQILKDLVLYNPQTKNIVVGPLGYDLSLGLTKEGESFQHMTSDGWYTTFSTHTQNEAYKLIKKLKKVLSDGLF